MGKEESLHKNLLERSRKHKEVRQTDARCRMRQRETEIEREREFRQCIIYLKHQNAVRTGKRKIQKEETPSAKGKQVI